MEKAFMFWQRWLLVMGVILSAFGLAFVFLNGTALFGWMDSQVNPVFFGSGELPDAATTDFKQWIYGVLGAVILGWGIFVTYLAAVPVRRREGWALDCIAAGALAWYVADTSVSLYYGVLFNAAFNSVLLIAIMLPVVLMRRYVRVQG